jgi:hypothetical protein
MSMETLTIEVPEKEVKLLKEILKKFNARIITKEVERRPNALTVKTIKDAQNGIGIEGPIEKVRDFINSL